jgi:hypothetical protein
MENPNIKHLEMPCTNSTTKDMCKVKAFIQVVIVDDPELQAKVDARASEKMAKLLEFEHSKGLHDAKNI